MDLRRFLQNLYSAEAAFAVAGLLFIGLGFGADIGQHLAEVAADPGHDHSGGDFFLRVNIPAIGIAFLTFGLGMYLLNHNRDRLHVTAFVAGLLVLVDGVAHLFAVSDHVSAPLQASFFVGVAAAQIGGGIWFPYLPRGWDRYWIAFTIILIAVFVASRRIAVPGLWEVEEVEPLGIFSKGVEFLSLVPLLSLVRQGRDARAVTATARPAEP